MGRLFKLMIFFAVIFAVLFCITWQNIQVYLYNRRIKELIAERNRLERDIYLLNIRVSSLKSMSRIAAIAEKNLMMVPVKPEDINLIIY